ncbi:MAG TPA: SDR family NAD(P)-dependent oxidoreductase [Candidatus Eisenbacteria bacterium]
MPDVPRARRALVTGGTDGIGKEAARALARTGHEVVIVGRDVEKGRRAEDELRAGTGCRAIEFMPADLGLMREVERLAGRISDRWDALHVLVHSAGVVRFRRELTGEGIEAAFAINALGRFALTRRLIPRLAAGGRSGRAARVVLVGGAARGGRIHDEDVSLGPGYNVVRSILQVQHANDVLTVEFARRLAREGLGARVSVTCLKIGVASTNIRQTFPRWARWLVRGVLDPFIGQTPAQAAAAVETLALDPTLEGLTGTLFEKVTRLRPASPGPRVLDPAEGRRLWTLCERLEHDAIGHDRPSLAAPTD